MNPTPSTDYSERVVVVTGSRTGLGKILSEHFLKLGARVVGISRGDSSIQNERYAHFQCDVGNADTVRDTFLKIAQSFDRIDILVNNAGVKSSQFSLLLSAKEAEAMVQVNLLGTFYCSREAAKIMKRNRWGRIINIGSMAANLEPVGASIYAASKAAISNISAVMAREFAAYNITCNTVGVTAIPTDMWETLSRESLDALVKTLPLPRYAVEDDILNVVDFFASPRSSYITAQTVTLGGAH